MASGAERSLAGLFQCGLKLSTPVAATSFYVPRRHKPNVKIPKTRGPAPYEVKGMIYLDNGGRDRPRDPNDPKLAKLPDGPKLGADNEELVPYEYGGKVKPHYHVFRQLWPEPSLFKRKFGIKADPTKTSKVLDHVEVPFRKARSSTAVLEALASTVDIESGSVPHDLMDDPYLLPLLQVQVAEYRSAKASGRRVAKRIVEDLPYFFDLQFFRPDPIIPSFEPGPSDWQHLVAEDGSGDFNSVIHERIQAGRYDLAFSEYSACREQGFQLSSEVLVSLFEIAAFHNLTLESDFDNLRPSSMEETEDHNVQGIRNRESYLRLASVNSTREDLWEASGIAEDLWRRIPKTDALHCAFVHALVRHGATQRAYDHFLTMIDEGKVVDLATFNSLLTWHNEIHTESQQQMMVKEAASKVSDVPNMIYPKILAIMAERGIRPNTATFNAVLHGLSDQRLPYRRYQAEWALIEMIDLELRPTLGTMALAIKAWRSQSDLMVHKLDWLLKIVESSDLETGREDDFDELFFPLAVNSLGMKDLLFSPEIPDLISRLHRLVRTNPNCRSAALRKFDGFRFFVRESMRCLLRNGLVDEAMDVFHSYVPNYFQLSVMDWLAIMTPAAEAAPIAVNHVVTLGNEFSNPLCYGVDRATDAFTSLLSPSAARDESELRALVAVAANYFRGYQRVQDTQDKKQQRQEFNVQGPEMPRNDKVYLSGYSYGNLLTTLAHGDSLDDAIDLFAHFTKESDKIVGSPPVEGVALLMRRVAKANDVPNATKGRVMVDALKFMDWVGAKQHLVEGLDLMVEEVALDASSAVIVTQLKKQLAEGKRKAEPPPRSVEAV